jgi:hypothetical protein
LQDAESAKGTNLNFSDSDSGQVSEHGSPAKGKKSRAANGAAGRAARRVSDHKLVLCPICFAYLVKHFGQEPGQKLEANPNPDPLASVVRCGP